MAKKKDPAGFSISGAETVVRRDLAEARTIREELLQTLAGGRDVQVELATIENEIVGYERALRQFAQAKEAVERASTTAARSARHAELLSKLVESQAGAEKLTAMCADAVTLVAALGRKLIEIEDQRAGVSALLHDAASDARGRASEQAILRLHESIHRAVYDATLPAAFVDALWRSGLSRAGIQVSDDYIRIRPMGLPAANREPVDAEASARDALAKLHQIVNTVTRWSEQANQVEAA